jgi:hypothetical protein
MMMSTRGRYPDLLLDEDDGSWINRIRHLNNGAAPGGDQSLPGGAQDGSYRRLGLGSKLNLDD